MPLRVPIAPAALDAVSEAAGPVISTGEGMLMALDLQGGLTARVEGVDPASVFEREGVVAAHFALALSSTVLNGSNAAANNTATILSSDSAAATGVAAAWRGGSCGGGGGGGVAAAAAAVAAAGSRGVGTIAGCVGPAAAVAEGEGLPSL